MSTITGVASTGGTSDLENLTSAIVPRSDGDPDVVIGTLENRIYDGHFISLTVDNLTSGNVSTSDELITLGVNSLDNTNRGINMEYFDGSQLFAGLIKDNLDDFILYKNTLTQPSTVTDPNGLTKANIKVGDVNAVNVIASSDVSGFTVNATQEIQAPTINTNNLNIISGALNIGVTSATAINIATDDPTPINIGVSTNTTNILGSLTVSEETTINSNLNLTGNIVMSDLKTVDGIDISVLNYDFNTLQEAVLIDGSIGNPTFASQNDPGGSYTSIAVDDINNIIFSTNGSPDLYTFSYDEKSFVMTQVDSIVLTGTSTRCALDKTNRKIMVCSGGNLHLLSYDTGGVLTYNDTVSTYTFNDIIYDSFNDCWWASCNLGGLVRFTIPLDVITEQEQNNTYNVKSVSVAYSGVILSLATTSGVVLYDISNVSAPVLVGVPIVISTNPLFSAIQNDTNLLWIAGASQRLAVFDISVIASPQLIKQEITIGSTADDLYVASSSTNENNRKLVYVALPDGLTIYELVGTEFSPFIFQDTNVLRQPCTGVDVTYPDSIVVVSLGADGIGLYKQKLDVIVNCLEVSCTTESADISTGALIVDGGTAITKRLNVGDDIQTNSEVKMKDSGVSTTGFKAPTTLTQTQVYTRPVDYPSISGQVLSSTTAGVESWISATTGNELLQGGNDFGIATNISVGANDTTSDLGLVSRNSQVILVNPTTTTTTSAFSITDATSSTNSTTGSLKTSGGCGILENLHVGGSTTITGDLTVNGTTVTLNTSTITVEDPIIELGVGNAANIKNIGFLEEFNDGTQKWSGMIRYQQDNKQYLIEGNTSKPTETENISLLPKGDLNVNSIIPSDGSASQPSIHFFGDIDTGFYRSSPDVIGVAIGGTQRKLISTTEETNTLPMRGPLGNVFSPTYSFAADTNTGLYSVGADQLGVTTAGAVRKIFSTTVERSYLPIQCDNGTVSLPSYSFGNDPNTGLYSVGADSLGISVGGGLRKTLTITTETNTLQQLNAIGSQALPTYSFSNDPNTGIFSGGIDILNFSTNGVVCGNFDASGDLNMLTENKVKFQDASGGEYVSLRAPAAVTSYDMILPTAQGSAGNVLENDGSGNLSWIPPSGVSFPLTAPNTDSSTNPSFSWDGGNNGTGMFLRGASDIGYSLGGLERMNIDNNALNLHSETALRLLDNTGGQYVGQKAPIVVGTSYTLTYPSNVGSTGQVLQTSDGAGNLGWASAIVNGGNSVGGVLTIGTNDAFDFSLEQGGVSKFTVGATATNFSTDNNVNVLNTTDSTSSSTGCLICSGGIGVSGNIYCDGFFRSRDGTASLPSYGFTNDTNTGVYSVGADQLGLTTGGVVRKTISTSAETNTLPLRGQSGIGAAPAYSFFNDSGSGLFQPALNQVGIAVNSGERFRIESGGQMLNVFDSTVGADYLTTLNPIYGCRAFCSFTGTTAVISASGNIASVVRNALGKWTLTFATPMPDANYTVCFGQISQIGSPGTVALQVGYNSKSTTTLVVWCDNSGNGSFSDTAGTIDVTVFR